MDDESWQPLEVDDPVPSKMRDKYWRWVRDALSADEKSFGIYPPYLGNIDEMGLKLGVTMPLELGDVSSADAIEGEWSQLRSALLFEHDKPLQIADYLLAHEGEAKVESEPLNDLLVKYELPWRVDTRSNHRGLVRVEALLAVGGLRAVQQRSTATAAGEDVSG